MFEYTLAEALAQFTDLPTPIRLWIRWLMAVNLLLPLVFIRHPPSWRVLVATVVVVALNVPLMMMTGATKVLALPHLLAWIPLVIYLAAQIRGNHIPTRSPFYWAVVTIVLTNVVSLVFDVRDGLQYIFGDRGIVTGSGPEQFPVLTTLSIIACFVGTSLYLLRPQPRESSA